MRVAGEDRGDLRVRGQQRGEVLGLPEPAGVGERVVEVNGRLVEGDQGRRARREAVQGAGDPAEGLAESSPSSRPGMVESHIRTAAPAIWCTWLTGPSAAGSPSSAVRYGDRTSWLPGQVSTEKGALRMRSASSYSAGLP